MRYLNRKSNDYNISETLVAGIILIGSEIKSVVKSEVDLCGSYILSRNDGIYLINAFISKNAKNPFGVEYNTRRDRKLLLNKSEIVFLKRELNKNKCVIPIEIFSEKNGKIKVKIAVGTRKKKWDKREKEKDKISKKEMF